MLNSGSCQAQEGTSEPQRMERLRQIKWVLQWILFANLAVAVAKYAYGVHSGLVSLRADALHSLTDAASNVVALVALRLSSAPPDPGHPYGHRKIDILASGAVAVLIILGMVEVASAALGSLQGRQAPSVTTTGFVLGLGTLLINVAVARSEARAGKRLNSILLMADARHTLSDSFATVCVLLGMVGVRLGFLWADLAAAAVVVVLVLLAAWSIFRVVGASLLDQSQIDPARIRTLALSVPGVKACHAIRSRGQPDFIFVDLHVLVDPDLTVREAHLLSHQVSSLMLKTLPEVADVLVHIEPWDDTDRPVYEKGNHPEHGVQPTG